MSFPTLTASTPIQLQFTSGQINVPLEDQDRFVAAAHRAVSASEECGFGGTKQQALCRKVPEPDPRVVPVA